MKNSIKILLIACFLLICALFFYSSIKSSSSDNNMKKETVEMEPENVMMKIDKEENKENMTTSKYVEYSKNALEDTRNTRRVLFFYASWCPTCKPADLSFKENEQRIPDDVTVIRVNYNDSETDQEEKSLAQEYGITYQHTFVQIDSQGKVVTKWNGGKIDELLSNIK